MRAVPGVGAERLRTLRTPPACARAASFEPCRFPLSSRVDAVMPSIADHLTAEHRRLEALLDAATGCDPIDLAPYGEFRRGLLRHIGIEEKLLLPAVQAAPGGTAHPAASRLRLDHGAIAALLVPTPTRAIVATLRHVLAGHDALEEGPDGFYARCDALLDVARTVADIDAFGTIPVSPHNDAPIVMPAVERALARAGYRLLG